MNTYQVDQPTNQPTTADEFKRVKNTASGIARF